MEAQTVRFSVIPLITQFLTQSATDIRLAWRASPLPSDGLATEGKAGRSWVHRCHPAEGPQLARFPHTLSLFASLQHTLLHSSTHTFLPPFHPSTSSQTSPSSFTFTQSSTPPGTSSTIPISPLHFHPDPIPLFIPTHHSPTPISPPPSLNLFTNEIFTSA
ncbi:hypothetical protein E2C01_086549 [Portunus trituberculatus]|uniref:Uncharacterized protein n=1 Tax=Portunus trituberculatus TaxID=210409 RepID=A0A5B7JEW0_PORTR|nr:hypothetical protein [Portunus trituberculatus]